MWRFAWVALVLVMSCEKERAPQAPSEAPPAPRLRVPKDESDPPWAKDPPAVLRDKINAVNAHVIVLSPRSSFGEYRDVLRTIERAAGVVAAEPFILAELQIAKPGGAPIGVLVKGVDPKRVGRVLALGPHLKAGTLDSLASERPAIVLGEDLARAVGVRLGDDVTVSQPEIVDPSSPRARQPAVFRVTALFHLDFDEYDERLAIVPLGALQEMYGRGDEVMGIEMTVTDLARSDELAKRIAGELGEPYVVQDWYELNKPLFTTLFGTRRP
jgi:lipoprotein-releasing system permease protein